MQKESKINSDAHVCIVIYTSVACSVCRAKDVRNKEFFEKHFPEIKRHTLRLGPKGFSVVRSEAELNEILDELYEQEEVRKSQTATLVYILYKENEPTLITSLLVIAVSS